ncbi:S-type pyocin domain-containing protein [Streptomyces sp. G44]|uniref:S-type pyocin domain-containing protein n=1 Tax=Streptomyces sp. G44 TaxID=2807632 RepID=UPI0019619A36|nr:S-type pyocin domain-containing protein [Streptomyces sp. G44]MBM7168978.1 S-type pyocin domain-containing protein [Streptomyces sp. G44]
MRPEEERTDNVIAFGRPQGAAEPVGVRPVMPEADSDTQDPPAMVLNAERGIINTGIVHGGQHVTAIEFSDRTDIGADGAV